MDRHEEVWLDEFVSRGATFGRQYLIVRQSAFNYGIRFVTTVLARWVAKERPDVPRASTKRARVKADAGASGIPGQGNKPTDSDSRSDNCVSRVC